MGFSYRIVGHIVWVLAASWRLTSSIAIMTILAHSEYPCVQRNLFHWLWQFKSPRACAQLEWNITMYAHRKFHFSSIFGITYNEQKCTRQNKKYWRGKHRMNGEKIICKYSMMLCTHISHPISIFFFLLFVFLVAIRLNPWWTFFRHVYHFSYHVAVVLSAVAGPSSLLFFHLSLWSHLPTTHCSSGPHYPAASVRSASSNSHFHMWHACVRVCLRQANNFAFIRNY